MSIETAPRIPQLWPGRLRIILDVWPYLDDEQRERLGNYFLMTWRLRMNRLTLASAIAS